MRNHVTGNQQNVERFGPRRSKARPGVPADHFAAAPRTVGKGKAKRSLKAVRAEIARRRRESS